MTFRPQLLKLDRGLVSGIEADEAKLALVEMLGELAGRLDAWLLAEGIETHAELAAVQRIGVPLGQGYYLAKPAPPWVGLSEQASESLESNSSRDGGPMELALLVDVCLTCAQDSRWPEAHAHCVRLAPNGAPLEMRVRLPQGVAVRKAFELLRVKRDAALTSVALRAATREESLRHDPLVCIGDDGRFEGLVHPHRLMVALATTLERGNHEPSTSLAPHSAGQDSRS